MLLPVNFGLVGAVSLLNNGTLIPASDPGGQKLIWAEAIVDVADNSIDNYVRIIENHALRDHALQVDQHDLYRMWRTAVTLAAGLTTNVAVFSTYQTGGSILDLSDIPEDIKTGKFDWTNQAKVRQYTYFTKWQWAATWYLSRCMKEAVDTKDEKTCNEHREEYDTAPEVRNPKASIEELRKYHESLMASRRL